MVNYWEIFHRKGIDFINTTCSCNMETKKGYVYPYLAPNFSLDSEPAFSFSRWQPENIFHFLWTWSASYYNEEMT